MRIIIFSDIHGNQYAFNTFLDKIKNESYDLLVFCGDVFGYYYGQNEIIEKLSLLPKIIAVKGNHDVYALNLYKDSNETDFYVEKYGRTYENIRNKIKKSSIDYIHNLPSTVLTKWCDKKVLICHGTPELPLEGRLYPEDEIPESAIDSYKKYDYIILGHTHFKMVKQIGNTKIINAGSLGQPRDGSGFGYIELKLPEEHINFINITFDKQSLINEIVEKDNGSIKLIELLCRENERLRRNYEKNTGDCN